mmetsp:Transcript_2133/g.5668  ORF Transcript_2133/g.5668 Transcript_2133/m.5668 type:complete len:531 (+) Transcript_2133:2382-3974(+)
MDGCFFFCCFHFIEHTDPLRLALPRVLLSAPISFRLISFRSKQFSALLGGGLGQPGERLEDLLHGRAIRDRFRPPLPQELPDRHRPRPVDRRALPKQRDRLLDLRPQESLVGLGEGHDLPQQNGIGKDVRLEVVRVLANDLHRHVPGGPRVPGEFEGRFGVVVVGYLHRQAEIKELEDVLPVESNVGRLEIPEQYPALVQIGHGGRNVYRRPQADQKQPVLGGLPALDEAFPGSLVPPPPGDALGQSGGQAVQDQKKAVGAAGGGESGDSLRRPAPEPYDVLVVKGRQEVCLHDEVLGTDHEFLGVEGEFWIEVLDDELFMWLGVVAVVVVVVTVVVAVVVIAIAICIVVAIVIVFRLLRQCRVHGEPLYSVHVGKPPKGNQFAQHKILLVKPRNGTQGAIRPDKLAGCHHLGHPGLGPYHEALGQIGCQRKVRVVVVVGAAVVVALDAVVVVRTVMIIVADASQRVDSGVGVSVAAPVEFIGGVTTDAAPGMMSVPVAFDRFVGRRHYCFLSFVFLFDFVFVVSQTVPY